MVLIQYSTIIDTKLASSYISNLIQDWSVYSEHFFFDHRIIGLFVQLQKTQTDQLSIELELYHRLLRFNVSFESFGDAVQLESENQTLHESIMSLFEKNVFFLQINWQKYETSSGPSFENTVRESSRKIHQTDSSESLERYNCLKKVFKYALKKDKRNSIDHPVRN